MNTDSDLEKKITYLINEFNSKNYELVISQVKELINTDVNIPIIYNLLGASYSSTNMYLEAIDAYQNALRLDSKNEEVLRNIGKCYLSQKKYKDAQEYFNKSLVVKKDNPDALFNLGFIEILLDKPQQGIQLLKQALNLNPSFTECIYNLGLCYKQLGDYITAIDYYLKAIQTNSSHIKSYNNLGVCYLILNDYQNALKTLNQCLEKNPNYSFALNNLGSVMLALKRFDEAESHFAKAYSLNKNLLNAGIQKIFLKRKNCDWSSDHEISELMRDTVALEGDVIPWQCLAFEDNPLNHLIRAKKFSRQFQLKSQNSIIYNNSKIRIGYFAIDFHQHPGMINMHGIFQNHNKKKFEIIGFYYGDIKKDEMHYKIKKNFDEFYYVNKLSDEEISQLSRKNKIDIAVNRSGHTDKARGNIFSYRPAPIQINYLGYPGTLGQEGIDYIIADKFVIPERYSSFYLENIIYFSDCFYPKDNNRNKSQKKFSRSYLEIDEDSFVFCSFNNSYKITEEEFKIWMHILKNVNNSFLVLLSNNEKMKINVRNEAIKNNVDPKFIKFVDYIDYEDHMARHEIFDLFLDSFNYNAHTSAVDSIWAELPILTKVGESFSSRICGSILSSLGFNDLIAYSKEEYEKKAIYFGNNRNEILNIKYKIIESKKKNNLYNIKKYTLKLEEIFEKVHLRRLENKGPSTFEIQ